MTDAVDEVYALVAAGLMVPGIHHVEADPAWADFVTERLVDVSLAVVGAELAGVEAVQGWSTEAWCVHRGLDVHAEVEDVERVLHDVLDQTDRRRSSSEN